MSLNLSETEQRCRTIILGLGYGDYLCVITVGVAYLNGEPVAHVSAEDLQSKGGFLADKSPSRITPHCGHYLYCLFLIIFGNIDLNHVEQTRLICLYIQSFR